MVAPARRRRQPLRAGEVAEPRLQPTVKFKPVDAPSLPELRELNELNYTRFDAKLEQRVVELETKIDRFAVELDTKIDRLAVELRAEMQVGFARMDQQLAQFEATLTKRMFVFWIGQAATTVGLVFGVVKLLH